MGLKQELEVARTDATMIVMKARDEGRELTEDERKSFDGLMAQANDLKARMEQAEKDQELLKSVDRLGDEVELIGKDGDDRTQPKPGRGKTVGEQFTNAPEFKTWLRQFPNGVPSEKTRVQSPAVMFGGLKTLVTGAGSTSAGALVVNQDLGLVDPTGTLQRPLTIRDIVTVGATGSDTVEYAKVTGFTNNAAPVAEATATSGTSGTKPESAITITRVTEAVKTLAHWIPATKRALADAAQLRTLIDGFLRYGLDEELEDQMVQGDGTGENFTGILNVSGLTTQAWDTDLFTTTRKARTKVRTTGRATPNAYILNPADWQTIDLGQDNNGGYYYGGPQNMGIPRLWGLPVVESEAVPAGTGLVGDFRQVVLWDREQTNLSVSDSHSDFFVRNMVAILAELRAAFGVQRPAAIVSIDLTA